MGGAASNPDDPRRRLRAKRQNERVKLGASFNTVALAILGAALILPSVSGGDAVHWNWVLPAIILHLLAHIALSFLKSEE